MWCDSLWRSGHRKNASVTSSGVPRILEWEGSSCRRCRGDEMWGRGIREGYPPPALPKGGRYPPPPKGELSPSPKGLCPSPEFFSYFWLIIAYFEAFWHVYFLNHTSMGGVLGLTPSLVRHYGHEVMIKRWDYSAAHWLLGDVMVANITFLSFLLFSMCQSIRVALTRG